ncbi:hypothetical protein AN391_01477 [Pseudoalteromonas sp. P1-13-1a]|nr:hypothetical protein AN391_01477 [Pseudoalteromonas sp. P1-13-1a]
MDEKLVRVTSLMGEFFADKKFQNTLVLKA